MKHWMDPTSDDILAQTPFVLGEIAKERRTRLGLTQQALAAHAGTTRRWLREFEAGKPTAQIDVVYRLLDALDLMVVISSRDPGAHVDLDELLGGYGA